MTLIHGPDLIGRRRRDRDAMLVLDPQHSAGERDEEAGSDWPSTGMKERTYTV
jgi:hypothetical protein